MATSQRVRVPDGVDQDRRHGGIRCGWKPLDEGGFRRGERGAVRWHAVVQQLQNQGIDPGDWRAEMRGFQRATEVTRGIVTEKQADQRRFRRGVGRHVGR